MVNDGDTATQPEGEIAEAHSIELIANAIAGLPNGKRAQLRRIYLTGRREAEGIVMGLLHNAGIAIPSDADVFRPWKLLAHSAAILSGTGQRGAAPHSSKRPFGRALHSAGLKEDRLLRLTAANGRILDALIVQSMRRIAQKDAGPVNLFTLFDLIRHGDNERGEEARMSIAKEFYTAEARSKKETASGN